MEVRQRKLFFFSLVGIFLWQTWLVYSDETGRVRPPLSEAAQAGRKIWHASNCQSCHQLFGFGGFLGPDLTNIAARLGPQSLATRLEATLRTGSDRMPAFHLDERSRTDLMAFLIEIDRMGVGQVKFAEPKPPAELFSTLLTGILPDPTEWSPAQKTGMAITIEKGCIDCHLPNEQSSFRATDLTRVHREIDREHSSRVLREGLPGKGMPNFGLQEEEVAALQSFLELLGEHGDRLRAGFESRSESSQASFDNLPWFEYSK